MEPRREVLRSPALVRGEVEIVERMRGEGRRVSGTAVKERLSRHLHGMLTRTPPVLMRSWLRGLTSIVQAAAPVPGNALLDTCRDVAALAAARGVHHEPRGIYRAFVGGVRTALETALALHHHGLERVAPRLRLGAGVAEALRAVRSTHGGFVLCVAHNPGAILCSTAASRVVPTVLIMRPPRSVARTRMALPFFERLGQRVLMAVEQDRMGFTRGCLRTLRDGAMLVATVDRVDRSEERCLVPFFGAPVGLSAFAGHLAVRARTAVVPAYVRAAGAGFELRLGAPLVPEEPGDAVRHGAAFLEEQVVEAPASWSFLADRRWRWVLTDAVGGTAASDGGRVRPSGRRAAI